MLKLKHQVAIACLLLPVSLAWAAPADDIRALLEQNKPKEAYQLGRGHLDRLGDPAFDFFYGIAAMDAGHPGEGVLALERYILVFPDNGDARFQLARGYFILGEDQRARDEFEALAPVAKGDQKIAMERFLDAIRARESRYQPTARFHLEAGLGFDSNINAGLSEGATPQVPGLGALPAVSSSSVSAKERDSFMTLGAGVQGTLPVAPGLALFGAVGFDARQYQGGNSDMFDQMSLGATGGVSYLKDKNLFKAGGSLSQSWVDDQRYVSSHGVNGEWHHQFDQFNRFSLGAQWARFNYEDMFVFLTKDKTGGPVFSQTSVRDSDFTGVSGAWSHAFALSYQPVFTLSGNYGEERNQRNRADLSRDIYGARATLALTPAPRWGAGIGVGYQESKYQDRFTAGSENRHDKSWSVEGSVSYFYTQQLSLRAEAQFYDQSSNIGLFDYLREVVAVKARYEF
ncbi:MAG: surface lipoprotein assembly modifier [Sulfuricella sp.]|nr:surface lipoprotein assembly modifier [Sulfuricella sp.]